MKPIRQFSGLVLLLCFVALYSCSKEEYFESDKMTRSELNVNYTGDFTVSTSLTKAEIKLENFTVVSGSFDYNGTWEIVQLDDDFLIIANDREGTSGIKELEFTKKK